LEIVPHYSQLFETIVETTHKRTGEIAAARMLLRRGAQQLDADRPYEAIRTLGRALGRLYKHESREDLVRALYLCGNAYDRVGLLWCGSRHSANCRLPLQPVSFGHTPKSRPCKRRAFKPSEVV